MRAPFKFVDTSETVVRMHLDNLYFGSMSDETNKRQFVREEREVGMRLERGAKEQQKREMYRRPRPLRLLTHDRAMASGTLFTPRFGRKGTKEKKRVRKRATAKDKKKKAKKSRECRGEDKPKRLPLKQQRGVLPSFVPCLLC